MPNLYVSLATVKSTGLLNISGTGDDARLRDLIEAVSRNIDAYVQREFFSQIRTLYFSGNGKLRMRLPLDLVSITSLTEDTDGDDVYDNTWATTDYDLWPYDASPTAKIDVARPYTAIEVNERTNGTETQFGRGQKRFKLTGIFGYSQSTVPSGSLITDAAGISASVTTINVTAGTDFKIGETILIESEQIYITNIAANALTVERAINGTTGATHALNTAISIVRYPSPVRDACMIESARLWKLKDSGFASSIGIPETGVVQTFGGAMHPRARDLLNPYRKLEV